MTDYNGRIHQIVRAFQQNPGDMAEIRFIIRKVLQDERKDGWQEGYSDGQEDTFAGYAAKAEAVPAQYAWTGTDSRGENRSGSWQMAPVHLEAVIEDRYETGWRALSVTTGGQEVAAIEPRPDKPGEQLWWAGER
jgi:hypothetical protein